jgi:hypothetical protein
MDDARGPATDFHAAALEEIQDSQERRPVLEERQPVLEEPLSVVEPGAVQRCELPKAPTAQPRRPDEPCAPRV